MNYQDLSKANRRQILHLILRSGGISRSEISLRSGLAKSTVSDITDRLLNIGIIKKLEIRKSGRRGRPKVGLSINPRRCNIIVVSYGAEGVYAHLVGPMGKIRATESRPLPEKVSLEDYLSAQVNAVECVGRRRWAEVRGITVVGPGVVDAKEGVLLLSGFRNWRLVQLREPFRQFGKPVFLQNGSRLRGLAENWYGAAADIDDFLYFHLDTGIGGAIVMDGALLEGPSHGAGEFGHMLMDESASRTTPCYCGARGCLESISSMTAIVKALASRRCKTFSRAWKLYREGDRAAVRVFSRAATALAHAIVNAVTAIGPTTALLGGGIVDETKGTFVSLIREKLETQHCLTEVPRVVRCTLTDDRAAILGSVAYALEELDVEQN